MLDPLQRETAAPPIRIRRSLYADLNRVSRFDNWIVLATQPFIILNPLSPNLRLDWTLVASEPFASRVIGESKVPQAVSTVFFGVPDE